MTIEYLRVQRRYRAVSTQLKRLDSESKSPLFSHFRESLSGLEVIRAGKLQAKMLAEHQAILDDSIRIRLSLDASNRWLGVRLDVIGSLIVSCAAFALLFKVNMNSIGVICTCIC